MTSAPTQAAEREATPVDPVIEAAITGEIVEDDGAVDGEIVEGQTGELMQPGDLVDENATADGVVVHAGVHGVLTIRPDQTRYTPDQKGAFLAIGIDVDGDPGVKHQLLAFLHMCQVRGLDPWAGEAHLIGRGKDQYRRWTMQTAIGGWLRMAKATGRYRGIAERLWTGPEDDQSQWYRDDKGIMRRVWWDQWPDSRGNPGAARAIIDIVTEDGLPDQRDGIADWGMFAPYTPKYEGSRAQGNRRKVIGADGEQVQELGEFWQRGPAYMLLKCALAVSLRQAFPRELNGMYTNEEMHQADAIEERRIAAERARERREVVRELRAANVPDLGKLMARRPATGAIDANAEIGEDDETSRPIGTVGEVIAEAVASGTLPEPETPTAEEPPAQEQAPAAPVEEIDDERRAVLLRAELDAIAEITGATVPALARRWVARKKKNVDAATLPELAELVVGLRSTAIAKLRQDGKVAQADSYAQVRPGQVGPVEWLLGESPSS